MSCDYSKNCLYRNSNPRTYHKKLIYYYKDEVFSITMKICLISL